MSRRAVLVLTMMGCGRIAFDDVPVSVDDATAIDMIDSAVVCSQWSPAVLVPGLESTTSSAPALTADELVLYYDDTSASIWVATRATTSMPFGTPVLVGGLDTASFERDPTVLPDGSTIVFVRNGNGLHMALRIGTDPTQFGGDAAIAGIAGGGPNPHISTDGMRLYFNGASVTPARTAYDSGVGQWGAVIDPVFPALVGTGALSLTSDERTAVLEHNSMTPAGYDVWIATRTSTTADFDAPTRIEELAGIDANEPWISPDGQALYFSVDTPVSRIMSSHRVCQ